MGAEARVIPSGAGDYAQRRASRWGSLLNRSQGFGQAQVDGPAGGLWHDTRDADRSIDIADADLRIGRRFHHQRGLDAAEARHGHRHGD
jgi:hypothetical protein